MILLQRWIPLSFVMNSLNRSMGMKDSYPFVINEAVKIKLNFIHETIQGAGKQLVKQHGAKILSSYSSDSSYIHRYR